MLDKRDMSILTQVVYKQRADKRPDASEWQNIVDEAVSLSVAIEKAWAKHYDKFKKE